MTTAEQIKQEIQDLYGEPDQPFLPAFDAFLGILTWRRAEVTLPSGIARLLDGGDLYVVFSVGTKLFRVNRDTIDHEWAADDLFEVEAVNTEIVEYLKKM